MNQLDCALLPDDFSITLDKKDMSKLVFTERETGSLRCRLVFDANISRRLPETVDVGVNRYGEILVTCGDSLIVQGDLHKWISLDTYAKGLNDLLGSDPKYVSMAVNGGAAILFAPERWQGQ